MKSPITFKLSVIFTLLSLIFMVTIVSEMYIYFSQHPEEILGDFSEDPIIVFALSLGYFILIWSLIVHLMLLIDKVKIKQIYYSSAILIILLFSLIFTIMIMNKDFTIILLNVFFIPLYIELSIIKFHAPTIQYLKDQ